MVEGVNLKIDTPSKPEALTTTKKQKVVKKKIPIIYPISEKKKKHVIEPKALSARSSKFTSI